MIEAPVFERDKTPLHSLSGYWPHLNAEAINAREMRLHVRAVSDVTAQKVEAFTSTLGNNMSVAERLPSRRARSAL